MAALDALPILEHLRFVMDFYGNFDGMIYYDIFAKLFMGPAHPGFVQASVAIRQNPDAMGEVHPCLRIILGFF